MEYVRYPFLPVMEIKMFKLWKKMICMTAVATVMCSLVACGNEKENNSNSDKEIATTQQVTTQQATTEEETVVITVLTDKEHLVNTKFAEYKRTFEKEYDNVEVRFEAVKNYEKELEKRLKEENYGDVLLIPDFVENTQLAEYFEPLGTVEELGEDYNAQYLQERAVDDVVYGLPRYVNVQGVAYNEVVWAKAGVIELPQTPEEFMMALRKIRNTQPEVIPYYTGYKNGTWLEEWQSHAWGSVTGNGEYCNNGIVTEQNPFSEGTSNYIVHEMLYNIVKNGLCEPYVENHYYKPFEVLLNRGNIGCMMLGSDYLQELQTADVNPDDISLMPFPYNIDGQQYATVEVDYCYAVNKNSPNKEVAKEWIEYMLKKSGYAKSEGAVSIKKKDSLPDILSNFEGVELVLNHSATEENEGKYEELNALSGIDLEEDQEKRRLIRSAIGESEESFEDIMENWNERWKSALRGVRYETKEE